MTRALLIFALTYVLISGISPKSLGLHRSIGAVLGAFLMILFGVVTPERAYRLVNADTVVLLLGTMILSALLERSGFYAYVAWRIAAARLTPMRLLTALSVVAGLLSSILLNDTVCLMLTPLVVGIVQRAGLPLVPYLMALATSANIGSALTLTGNPQNMIIGSMSRFEFGKFLAASAAPVAAAMMINLILLRLYYGRRLSTPLAPPADSPPPPVDRVLLWKCAACIALAVAGFLAAPLTGLGLAWTSLGAGTLLLLASRCNQYEVLAKLDWPLLLFFSALFIVVGAVGESGCLAVVDAQLAGPLLRGGVERESAHLTWLTLLGSQVFSNVPYVLVAGPWMEKLASPRLGWLLLAYVSTVAGNLTILGSVANVIVLEQARHAVTIGFVQYLKFGVATTLATTAAGVAIFWVEQQLGWIS